MENQGAAKYLEDEVDLRIYIQAILKNWFWIVIPAVIVAIGSFFVLSILPETYLATALVSVSSPSIDVVFDSRIVTTEDGPTVTQNNDLPNLALSDAVIFDLYSQIKDELPQEINSYTALSRFLAASTETRSEIVSLSGSSIDPELSALIVNTWSQIFVREANKFFEGEVDSSQVFLIGQLDAAEADRARINEEWALFQSQNKIDVLSAQLESKKTLQKTYINRSNNLELLEYDIQGILNQVQEDPNNESLISELTLYTLQNRAFNTGGNLQVELSSFENFESTSLSERLTQLNALNNTIAQQKSELTLRIAEVEPDILMLQNEITELETMMDGLETERSIILNTYDTLAKKVAEGEIEQNNTTGKAQLASRAIVPVEPEPSGRITTSAIAAIGVSVLAVIVILALTWWKEESKK